MPRLTRLITRAEANGLREAAQASAAPLNIFLPNQSRIGLGLSDGTPFRITVKVGPSPGFDQAELERYKLGLWSREYFGKRPRCRSCGEMIADGDKALCFAFNPN